MNSRLQASLRLALILILLTQIGCARRHQPILFGLYDVPAEAFPEVKQAGFDLVTIPASTDSKKYLNAAQQNGLQVLHPSSAFSGPASRSDAELRNFDRHPALWAWHLYDEPDLHDLPPQHVSRIAHSFQLKARKPAALVLASGSAAATYAANLDLLMVDFYPVPWAPVSRFAKEMRLAKFARAEKPFFAVVQAFDWTHFSDVLGQTNNLRAPTIAEIRCMSYLALALEARGLFFYSYASRAWRLADSPLWPELKNLIHELRKYSPLFQHPPLWWPTDVEFAGPMYNEVHDSIVLTRLYHLASDTDHLRRGYYFVVINTVPTPTTFSLRIPFSSVTSIPHHNKTIPLENGWLRQTYDPYEVKIFGPFAPEVPLDVVRSGIFR